MVEVMRYARYLGGNSDGVYNYPEFCGQCRRELGTALLAKPKFPEDLDTDRWHHVTDDREYERWMFCPFCGAAFDDEWWKDQMVRNLRVTDHFKNPGTHCGDEHIFDGFHPGGHWLTGECWCEPIITPSIVACEIRHRRREQISR